VPKIPDRKKWDSRTRSYMRYPGIPRPQIVVGFNYLIDFVDMEISTRLWHTVVRADEFKTGRRWKMVLVAPDEEVDVRYLYERDILEQHDRRLVVGLPWNYEKFNPPYHAPQKKVA
jgi:hypothetical protein